MQVWRFNLCAPWATARASVSSGLLLLLAIALSCAAANAAAEGSGSAQAPAETPKPGCTRELNMFTFPRSGNDDRAYFIMFYVPWCRGCKRMAEQWDALADAFSADRRVVLAKFDCMQDEDFCAEREGINHTPTLKLYHRGKGVETYKADIYHVDLMRPFLASRLDRLMGGGAAAASPQQHQHQQAQQVHPSQPTAAGSAAPAPAPAASRHAQMQRPDLQQKRPDHMQEPGRVIYATHVEPGVYDRPANASLGERSGDTNNPTEYQAHDNAVRAPVADHISAAGSANRSSRITAPPQAPPPASIHSEEQAPSTAAVEELQIDPTVVDMGAEMVTDAHVQPAHATGDAADDGGEERAHVRQGRNGGPAVEMLQRDREEL